MEPRPDKPRRRTGSVNPLGPTSSSPGYVGGSTSPLDPRSTRDWGTPSPGNSPTYGPATTDPGQPVNLSGGAWYGQPAAAPGMPDPSRPYSPGPALTPLAGSRGGSKLLGPLLALAALGLVIVAVVFAFSRARDGDDQRNLAQTTQTTATAPAPTAGPTQAAVAPTVAPTKQVVAGAGETAVDEPTTAPDESDAPTETPAAKKPANARTLLPGLSDLPADFKQTQDDTRTLDEVAAAFADPAEATQNLTEWGWEQNAFREFQIPAESNPDPNATSYMVVSVHRFETKKGAAKAVTYFADDVATTQGLKDITVDEVGDQTRALSGAPQDVNLVILYVRSGQFLIRIGGSSVSGDPTQDVVDLATKIVEAA